MFEVLCHFTLFLKKVLAIKKIQNKDKDNKRKPVLSTKSGQKLWSRPFLPSLSTAPPMVKQFCTQS